MISIVWKIIIASVILIETMAVAFLGWRVLGLMRRVKIMQADRNRSLEIYTESREENAKISNALREKGIEIDELKKKKPIFEALEKKMILNALSMLQYKSKIEEPQTNYQVRETYKQLKKKIKESFGD